MNAGGATYLIVRRHRGNNFSHGWGIGQLRRGARRYNIASEGGDVKDVASDDGRGLGRKMKRRVCMVMIYPLEY